MPISVANTTLSLSQIDQLREIVLQTNAILGTTIDPFSLQNLNKSEWWQYEFSRQILSQTLVSEGYSPLPEFTISDLNNGQLPIVLINYINASLLGSGTAGLLIPFGASETADGIFQRFITDGTNPLGYPAYYAELNESSYAEAFVIDFKWPNLSSVGNAVVVFFSTDEYLQIENSSGDEADPVYSVLQMAFSPDSAFTAGFSTSKFGTEPVEVPLSINPVVGEVVTLEVSKTSMMLTANGSSQIYSIPEGTFNGFTLLNVAVKVEGSEPPLSIKVVPAIER